MTGSLTPSRPPSAKCGHLDYDIAMSYGAWAWDGDGLTSAERALWRSRRALFELAHVLLHDECFVANLSEVRSALDRRARAWQIARRYGIADRRTLVAALMARGAEHDDRDAAGLAMCNVGAMAITSVDGPRTQRQGTYLVGEAFLAPIQYGCDLLAEKGGGRSLTRSEERAVRRVVATILQGVRRTEQEM